VRAKITMIRQRLKAKTNLRLRSLPIIVMLMLTNVPFNVQA
jgi:hypothetical protein